MALTQDGMEVNLNAMDKSNDLNIQDGSLGLGPNIEYLSCINTSALDRSRRLNFLMIIRVD